MTHSSNALSWALRGRRGTFAAMKKPSRRAPVTPRTLVSAELAATGGGSNKVLDNPAYEVALTANPMYAAACTNPLYSSVDDNPLY